MAAVGKITKIGDIATQKLSGGQVAAIVVTLAVAIIGGFAGYAFYKDRNKKRESNYNDDDDDDYEDGGDGGGGKKKDGGSRIGGLYRDIVRKMRGFVNRGGGGRRTEALPSSEPKVDPGLDAESESDAGSRLTGEARTGRTQEKDNTERRDMF